MIRVKQNFPKKRHESASATKLNSTDQFYYTIAAWNISTRNPDNHTKRAISESSPANSHIHTANYPASAANYLRKRSSSSSSHFTLQDFYISLQSQFRSRMTAQRQASSASQTPHISPAELSYLYTSLSLPGTPIRPDGRSPTQFRPLSAETDILPGTNGSARVGFADGTQAIVGVKAEVEKTALGVQALSQAQQQEEGGNDGAADGSGSGGAGGTSGQGSWVQMAIEIPGFRDDDALPVFLSEMMREPLVESVSGGANGNGNGDEMAGGLKGRLVINRRWHWRLYIDVSFCLLYFYEGLLWMCANSNDV